MLHLKLGIFFLFVFFQTNQALSSKDPTVKPWTGRWFPEPPTIRKPVHHGRIPMGVANRNCDDAKTNLTIDWDGSFQDYTCLDPRNRIIPNQYIDSIIEYDNIPQAYEPPHFCMNDSIIYNQRIPSYGAHRPLWAMYGEYKFLPKQRWLHNLEHGGLAALYHPCADLRQIYLLKKIVKSCLRRHVISPSSDLTPERPLALVTWGVRFTMSTVYPNAVRQFIRENALKGPEKTAKEGQYTVLLQEKAAIVTDFEDSILCPDS